MKNYKNFLKNKFDIQIGLKRFLIFLGIKKLTYIIIHFMLSIIFKSKLTFLRSLVFDYQKRISEIVFYTNKYNEKFGLFSNDNIISKEIFVNEEFDLQKLIKTLNFLNKKSKIKNLYDIGANIGSICIPAVKRNLVESAFAVEPVFKNFQLLKINIILNNLEEKIKSFNIALSSKDDQNLDMELASDNSGDHRIRLKQLRSNLYDEEMRKIEKVKTKKFDTLFQNLNGNSDLVWIDTQGFEPIILSGAQNLLKSKTPIVLEFWPYGLKRNDLWKQMRKTIEMFNYFSDLSEEKINLKKINKENLDELFSGWEDEKKNQHALFTDLLLINNNF
jgi:FkbM family methyltransferase